MLYVNAIVEDALESFCQVEDDDAIIVYPSVISRLPQVGDSINYLKSDGDEYGVFVGFSDESPAIYNGHAHKLFSDNTINNMPVDEAQKASLRAQTTGGVE